MSTIGDFVKGVVSDVLEDLLRKATTSKRGKRRKSPTKLTAAERLRHLERMVKPARKQTSRRKTVSSRSKAKQRSY